MVYNFLNVDFFANIKQTQIHFFHSTKLPSLFSCGQCVVANTKIGREDIFQPIGKFSKHTAANANGQLLLDFSKEKR